jgi:hypothetical protein
VDGLVAQTRQRSGGIPRSRRFNNDAAASVARARSGDRSATCLTGQTFRLGDDVGDIQAQFGRDQGGLVAQGQRDLAAFCPRLRPATGQQMRRGFPVIRRRCGCT